MKTLFIATTLLFTHSALAMECKLEAQYQQVTVASVEAFNESHCAVKLAADSVQDYRVNELCALMKQPVLEWKNVVDKGVMVFDDSGNMCEGMYKPGQVLPGGRFIQINGNVYFD